jgi:hypothetical protein
VRWGQKGSNPNTYLFYSRNYDRLDAYKDSLSTIYPKEPCKLNLLAVYQWGEPALNGRKVYKNVLPDFTSGTTDS